MSVDATTGFVEAIAVRLRVGVCYSTTGVVVLATGAVRVRAGGAAEELGGIARGLKAAIRARMKSHLVGILRVDPFDDVCFIEKSVPMLNVHST